MNKKLKQDKAVRKLLVVLKEIVAKADAEANLLKDVVCKAFIEADLWEDVVLEALVRKAAPPLNKTSNKLLLWKLKALN